MDFQERSTHVYRQKQMFTKEELSAIEGLCVYEQPAYCVAACPLKLDTKAMITLAAKGDFNGARKLYERIAPFPHILCSGCDAPCEKVCKRREAGEAVNIKGIEAAIMTYGDKPKAGGLSMFRRKKPQKAALYGTDLFILLLAGELSQKSYPVSVFCQQQDLEAYFKACLSSDPELSCNDFLLKDLDILRDMKLTFHYSCELSKELIRENETAYEITALSGDIAAAISTETPDFDKALMLWTSTGRILGPIKPGVSEAAFGAKKAALSADRIAQGISPDNTRGEEGPVETRLYTSLEGIDPANRVKAAGNTYTKEEAVSEAGRCIACHCDECIKGCAYLKHYKKYPRVLTREIYNNVGIIMGDHMMNKPINACSLCGQCTVTCPNGYDLAKVCHTARENMVFTGKMPLAPHEFALHDLLFSNNEAFLCRKQPGYNTCRYVFFPGCQAAAVAPDTVKAAYQDLCSRLDGGVALILGCCGAICDWAGRYEMYDDTKAFILDRLHELGDPVIIAGCPTCKKELDSYSGCEITGIWDVLCDIGLPENTATQPKTYALHDSCGARGDKATQDTIRKLVKAMGITLIDTPYSGDKSPCCGYGGLTAYANPQVAKEMTEHCLERSELPYISYCMACRDRFARQGRESSHLLELIYGSHAGPPPDISEKRYNRLSLKAYLLEELWGERREEQPLTFELNYTPEALVMMDERMILKSDVEAVMKDVYEKGEAILDMEDNLLASRIRLGNVTFWVKYERTASGYLIHRAYSHRMNVETR